jgi:hypothetical protein
MLLFGGTLVAGALPVGVKFGAGGRPAAPMVFHADALVGPAALFAARAVGLGLARVGIVEFGLFAAIPVDDPVLAQPVIPDTMTIPAHVPAVRMDIVTSAPLRNYFSSKRRDTSERCVGGQVQLEMRDDTTGVSAGISAKAPAVALRDHA